MTDVLAWRKSFGVLAPSTNTIVEPEFAMMRIPGVSAHFSRIHITDADISSDEKMRRLLDQLGQSMESAIDRVKTADVSALVMGMSLETFWGGLKGNKEFLDRLQNYSGLKVFSGAKSVEAALQTLEAQKISVLTPYQPIGDKNVRIFFNDLGIDVVELHGLRCPTAQSIAQVSAATLRLHLTELAATDCDAIIQVGTNLAMVELAAEAERWLNKPVIAINAATWWHALRESNIGHQIQGFGSLLEHH